MVQFKREKRRRIRRVTKLTRFRYFAPARPTLYIGEMTNSKFCGHALSLDKVYFFPVRAEWINRILQFWPSRKNVYFCTTNKNIFKSAQQTRYFGTSCQGKISVHLWPRKRILLRPWPRLRSRKIFLQTIFSIHVAKEKDIFAHFAKEKWGAKGPAGWKIEPWSEKGTHASVIFSYLSLYMFIPLELLNWTSAGNVFLNSSQANEKCKIPYFH